MAKRTGASKPIFVDFVQRLAREAEASGCELSLWRGEVKGPGRKPNRSVLELTGAVDLLLYVRVRSSPPGFWGLTRNRIADLESSGRRWALVLLLGTADTGYFVPSEQVIRRIGSGAWRPASDGDWRVYEGRGLDFGLRFRSLSELAQKALT